MVSVCSVQKHGQQHGANTIISINRKFTLTLISSFHTAHLLEYVLIPQVKEFTEFTDKVAPPPSCSVYKFRLLYLIKSERCGAQQRCLNTPGTQNVDHYDHYRNLCNNISVILRVNVSLYGPVGNTYGAVSFKR